MHKLFTITLILSLCAAFCCVSAVDDVVVKNLKLFVDGKEYIVKGMAYNPAPISFLNNTGLCSHHVTPFADVPDRSACFDSDFWDSRSDYPRDPPGPSNGWFRSLWERDLPDIKNNVGANTLRLYNVNPSNYLATVKYNGSYNIVRPYGKDHRQFLDYCESLGLKVIWPLYSDATGLLNGSNEALEFYMRAMIEEVGNHTAILMYNLGNELNYVGDEATWKGVMMKVNHLIDYSRDYQHKTWNRTVPFTTTTDDNPDYYDWLMQTMHVDVFTANAGYRGRPALNIFDFYNLWSGEQPRFAGFHNLSCYYQVPLLIGEINPVGYENPPAGAYYPTGFPQMWKDLIDHIDQGCIGGVFFEYTDELWKAFGRQSLLGIVNTTINCNASNACSDQESVWLPDKTQPKGWEYQAVCCGEFNGKPYNFKSDPFSLLGRAAQTLDNAVQPCNATWIKPGGTVNNTTAPAQQSDAHTLVLSTLLASVLVLIVALF